MPRHVASESGSQNNSPSRGGHAAKKCYDFFHLCQGDSHGRDVRRPSNVITLASPLELHGGKHKVKRFSCLMIHSIGPGLAERSCFHCCSEDSLDLCDVLSSFSSGAQATLNENQPDHGADQ